MRNLALLSLTFGRTASRDLPSIHCDTAVSGSTVNVSFYVTNTGSVEGAEVAQVYVSDPSAKAQRPERELKGFAKSAARSGPKEACSSPDGSALIQLLG